MEDMTTTPVATAGPGLLRLMAVATGLSAASLYVAYPILDLLRDRFGMSDTTAGLLVTVAQAGYAAGLLLLVPMSDVVRRRPLALTLLTLTAAALVVAGAAQTGAVLLVASALAAVTAVGAQVIVPYAAELAGPREQAHAVGVVMSGVILGGLLSRFLSGVLTDAFGWRTPYFVLAAALLAAAAGLARTMPRHDPDRPGLTVERYRGLLASMIALVRAFPALRLRSVLAALSLASFVVQGAAVTFLLAGPRFGWTPTAIGTIGLLGAVGALSGPVIGRIVDRGHGALLTTVGLIAQPVAWCAMLLADGAGGLSALIVGLVLLGIGQQAVLNTSQAVLYALVPEARGRINAVFMGTFFIGGTLGSAATAALWPVAGWTGCCLLGVGLATTALVLYLAFRAVERPGPDGAAPSA
ncbi:MFS transporter [Tsukamurella spumae]